MSQSLLNNYIHLIFSTKSRANLILPEIGLKRGAEFILNQEKIRAMILEKAIREGINPDKGIEIINQFIKILPSISNDQSIPSDKSKSTH